MYISNFGYQNVGTFCIILQRIFPETLRDLHRTLGDLASFCLPAIGQERRAWQSDSLPANSNASESDTQQVYTSCLKCSIAGMPTDIDGSMGVYWKSPELLVVVDAEQFNGWQQLHHSYVNGYPDRVAMGFIQPKRIQVKLLKPDLHSPLPGGRSLPNFQTGDGKSQHHESPKV